MDMVLLSVLACPVCGGKLLFDQQEQNLLCRADRLGFSIVNGVPNMKCCQAFKINEENY